MPPFPYCGRFTEPEPNEPWTCMDESDDNAGCGINCRACTTDSLTASVHGAWIHGKRWLRPSATRDSRDGTGLFHFPRSGDIALSTRLYPAHGANFELALYWQQIAAGVRENFEQPDGTPYSLCDCGTGSNVCPAGLNSALPGPLCTCWVAYGGYPPGGPFTDQHCTGKFDPDRPIRVRFVQGGFNNLAIINMGSGEGRSFGHLCSIDKAAQCWGHQEGDNRGCNSSDSSGYYNTNNWPDYDWLYVHSLNCTFGGTHPEDVLRNMAMAWLKEDVSAPGGRTNLDQLNSPRRNRSELTNLNSLLGKFARGFSWANPFNQVTPVSFANTKRIAPLVASPTAQYTVIEGVPDRATSDVTITVDARSDFSNTPPFVVRDIKIWVNGTFVGQFFGDDFATTCQDESETVTIPRDFWNNLVTDNGFTVQVFNVGTTASTCGGETYSETTISYEGVNDEFVGTPTYENIPAVAPLVGRTRLGGFPATGQYILLEAGITVFLSLPIRNTADRVTSTASSACDLMATVHFVMTMGIRADVASFNAQGHELVEHWKKPADRPPAIPVRMSNNQETDVNNMPSIDGGVDQIDWFLPDGRSANVPPTIKWLGHMGYTSEDPPHPVLHTTCTQVRNSLAFFSIPSRASHIAGLGKDLKGDSRKRLIWTGSLDVGLNA